MYQAGVNRAERIPNPSSSSSAVIHHSPIISYIIQHPSSLLHAFPSSYTITASTGGGHGTKMANFRPPTPTTNEDQPLLISQPASDILSNSMNDEYLTPRQLGYLELYELIPFVSIFGMQVKSRKISRAFVGYAYDVQTDAQPDVKKKEADSLLVELDAALMTPTLIMAVLTGVISQLMVGYNVGVLNSSYDVIFPNCTIFQWTLAVAMFALGGVFGAYCGGLIDRYGRRRITIINSFGFLVGGLIQSFAFDLTCLTIGRFVIGLASGSSTVLVPIYIGELVPPTLRGTVGTVLQFSLVSGILVSNLLAFPYANEESWRYLFVVTVVLSIIHIICSLSVVESPRWLLAQDPKSTEARKALKQLRGLRYGNEVDAEINLIMHASNVQSCNSTDGVLNSMTPDKKIRKLLMCILFLQVAHQLCGISAVFYYSTMIFKGLIDYPILGTAIIGAINVAAMYAALLLLENSNRKTLLLFSAGGMIISSAAFILCQLGDWGEMLLMIFVVCYTTSYAVGLGKDLHLSNNHNTMAF